MNPMHRVDLLEQALVVAQRQGFDVRREWLGGKGGGACRIGNQWHLFVDLSLPPDDQLAQVMQALESTHNLAQRTSPRKSHDSE